MRLTYSTQRLGLCLVRTTFGPNLRLHRVAPRGIPFGVHMPPISRIRPPLPRPYNAGRQPTLKHPIDRTLGQQVNGAAREPVRCSSLSRGDHSLPPAQGSFHSAPRKHHHRQPWLPSLVSSLAKVLKRLFRLRSPSRAARMSLPR